MLVQNGVKVVILVIYHLLVLPILLCIFPSRRQPLPVFLITKTENESMNKNVSDAMDRTFDSISSAILQKQQELTHLNDYRFKSLETTILEKNKQLERERQQLKQLKADFDYNLKLLEARDEELQQYDRRFVEVRQELMEK